MNFIDLLIISFIIVSLFRGREIGFVRQLFSTIGFFGGLWLGALIQRHSVGLMHTTLSKTIFSLTVILGFAVLLLAVGEYVGILLKKKVHRPQLNWLDNFFGSILSAVSILIAVWLSASIASSLPYPGLKADIRQSKIISFLNDSLPPAPEVMADIGHLIDPNGFPQVFIGSEPSPPEVGKIPNMGSLQAAVNKTKASVVKVEGQGCGGIVEGSGFVVGNDLVATNAHVVAGIATPYVADGNGLHKATPIWFDPDLDFAVLRVNNLAGKPLVIDSTEVSPGTAAAVLGYPSGGGFEADPAAVLDEFTAVGRNIYGQGSTHREVYELRANVVPGNSGGPLIAKDSSVIGVIFAESTTYKNIGYALTAQQVKSEINQAQAQDHVVSTGSCTE